MSPRIAGVILCSFCMVFVSLAGAENTVTLKDGQESPPAVIGDVAWIAGHWRGPALGGVAEEVWSPPAAGAMMGMFRYMGEKGVGFYELLTITEAEGSLRVTLKHFNPDLTGWEEKNETVTFDLVKVEARAAYFDGMTFRKSADTSMEVYVRSDNGDGTFGELKFAYHAVK